MQDLSGKIQSTQEYCLFISDEAKSVTGSGLLFYPGGDILFAITARHLINDIESDFIHIHVLFPINPAKDEYQNGDIVIPKKQAAFPADAELDFAVVPVQISEDIKSKIHPSEYFVTDAVKKSRVYIHGFPGGWLEGEELLEALDYAEGAILRNVPSNHRFTLRNTDSYLNQSYREHELEGFSGSPVWNADDEVLCVNGILTSGARGDIYRARLYAEKMEYVRSFMKNKFGIYMQTKIEGIPESDVAGQLSEELKIDGTLQKNGDSHANQWISKQIETVRSYIDDLQYQKAIDTAKESIADKQFKSSDKDNQRDLMQHLLYCYEIIGLNDEFVTLDKRMASMGLVSGHDYLRMITSSFSKRKYEDTVKYASEWAQTGEVDESKKLIIKVYTLLSNVFIQDLTYEESIAKLLDKNDCLIYQGAEVEAEALIYQTIGYVLGEHFHKYTQSIRCLNKSYRVGFDKMVLETLASAYYFYSIADATDAVGIVNVAKIDHVSLNKARECFILIMDKADELFWKSTIERVGLVIYNTFVFSMDNYRIMRIYPDIRRYLPDLPEKELHDVEKKYARLDCLKGSIDFDHYATFNGNDKKLFSTLADLHGASKFFDDNPLQVVKLPQIEERLKKSIKDAENVVNDIDKNERLQIRVSIINLYGKGIFTYGWNSLDKILSQYDFVKESGNNDLIKSLENFIYECGHSFDEVEPVFIDRFERDQTIQNWGELRNFYIRHYQFDKCDALYKDLFDNHQNLIASEQEFAYRDYIDYVTHYRRNILGALKCFLNERSKIKDPDIADYWELELMMYTNTFNEPDRFETDRFPLVEDGIMTEEEYHRGAFIAYLNNLNYKKCTEHNYYLSYAVQTPYLFENNTPKEEIYFLAWRGLIRPLQVAVPNEFMLPMNQKSVESVLHDENWHVKISDIVLEFQSRINRTVAVDAWSLCLLEFNQKLAVLRSFDRVYVSHLTITRLLNEASKTAVIDVHNVLDWIEKEENIVIESADFEHQISIREKVRYGECESTIAIATEKKCPAILCEPHLDAKSISNYKNMIVRGNRIQELVDEMV